MEQINGYLQSLISASAYELHFEPNKSPFILSDHGVIEVSSTPLSGANISQLIFPIIPAEAKQKLPNQPEIAFDYNNPTGSFGFVVKKSPAGFHVIVKPLDSSYDSNVIPATFETPAFENNSYQEPLMPAQNNSVFSVTSGDIDPASADINKPPRRTSLDNVFESSSLEATVNGTYETLADTSIADEIVPLDDYYFSQPEPAPAPVSTASYAPAEEVSDKPAFAYLTDSGAAGRMDVLFTKMAECGASDLHMSVSMPPMMRKDGKECRFPAMNRR